MPDARFNADGTLQLGLSYANPYLSFQAAATLLPWLETNLGVTQISGVPGVPAGQSGFGAGYGAYKDKTSGLKVRLLSEGSWRPAVALGVQDPIGTSLFQRQYLAATKTLADACMKLFHPLGVMLASPVNSVDEAMKRFAELPVSEGTDHPSAETLIPGRVSIEDKYDGVRAQLHCGDPNQPGRVELFSRSREDLSEAFPELVEAFAGIREPVDRSGHGVVEVEQRLRPVQCVHVEDARKPGELGLSLHLQCPQKMARVDAGKPVLDMTRAAGEVVWHRDGGSGDQCSRRIRGGVRKTGKMRVPCPTASVTRAITIRNG